MSARLIRKRPDPFCPRRLRFLMIIALGLLLTGLALIAGYFGGRWWLLVVPAVLTWALICVENTTP